MDPINDKILRFQKFKMAAAPFGKLKNHNISSLNRPVSTKFGMVVCLNPPDLVSI